MADFKHFFKRLSIAEGGYVNDKDDKGGETYRGITRKYHPNWHGWVTIDSIKKHHPNNFKTILKNIPELNDKVYNFYKSEYWDCFEFDDIPSQRIAEEIADTAVNCGHKTAITLAQQVTNMSVTGEWSNELKYNLMQYGKSK